MTVMMLASPAVDNDLTTFGCAQFDQSHMQVCRLASLYIWFHINMRVDKHCTESDCMKLTMLQQQDPMTVMMLAPPAVDNDL